MSATSAVSITPDLQGSSAPTRVLADLGGSSSPGRSKATAATLFSGAIAIAAGSLYWANSNVGTPAAPPVQAASVAAVDAPQNVPVAPVLAIAAAPASETVATAARIVSDDTPPNKMDAPVATTPHLAATPLPPATPVVSANAAVLRAADKGNRTTATGTPGLKTRTARAAGKPTAMAAKKARSGNQVVASNSAARKSAVAKRLDPDTDLLAALLRRSDGQTQASLATRERVR